MSEYAEISGIVDKNEVLQAIRFLSDLGSVQYFEVSGLKDKVIIYPQWIVDAFANIVSVKKNHVVEGKLNHEDLSQVWANYEPDLHDWMLKLTEKFDLTFSLPNKRMSIVPCLLPEVYKLNLYSYKVKMRIK